ncbi:hypothetical protein RSOLAG1IB_00298 [Rhizoctonia solani AG-1 IB]|uniref:Uncharacterized protein n=1 Tax=Thanatephorus cucumeris (strain AG1-IB / isolate 7/3/14) TaxID=1108050 RepID=A0A0B7F6C9_THACB|nr:hypothetical protein RSOLAG1IB_00298 [Rhizoctonia solani AG-1 IB]
MIASGASLTLFRPDIAIDAMGRVLVLKQVDWNALTEIAEEITSLPKPKARPYHPSAWEMNQDVFCVPAQDIYVFKSNVSSVVRVRGWRGERSQLSYPVGNITNLPDSLHSLLIYSREVWRNYIAYREGANKVILDEVRRMFPVEPIHDEHSLDDLD